MKTTHRFEKKYQISYKDYYKIKPQIAALLQHDQHTKTDAYPVYSIYLDDLVYSGASDKAFGNETHKKYRIRYYENISQKKLELKYKVGDDSVKHSVLISNNTFEAIMDQDIVNLSPEENDPLLRRLALDMRLRYLRPVAKMRYDREAYMDSNNQLRITFDHSLKTTQFTNVDEESDIPLYPGGHLIFEVKYEHYVPKEIKYILNNLSLNQISYSKYFMAYYAQQI